jgi:type I restriction enzyme S subunit
VKGTISSDDVLYISPEKHETLKKGHLKTGDVLFTNRGEIGKVAIVPKEFDGANLNSQIAWLRSSGEILPEYLYFFLQSSEMKRHFSQTRSGTALQQFTIKMLKEVAISYPIKDIQLEIVENLKKLSLEIGSLEAVYQKKLATLAELKQTILQKAFSGELTALPGAEMQVEAA